jgi:hypothetical protein
MSFLKPELKMDWFLPNATAASLPPLASITQPPVFLGSSLAVTAVIGFFRVKLWGGWKRDKKTKEVCDVY